MPPRSRRGGARLLCGLHHRHVGHNAFRVHPCSWQVHGISIAKKIFLSGCALALGAAGFRVFMSHDRPYVSVRIACGFTLCTAVQQSTAEKHIHQQSTIPPCVYNNSTYSSTTAEKKAKTQRRGDSTDALSRMERSTVEPTENVVITCHLRESNFENRRSPSLAATPVLSPGIARAAVWVGLRAVARSRGIRWRPGAAIRKRECVG